MQKEELHLEGVLHWEKLCTWEELCNGRSYTWKKLHLGEVTPERSFALGKLHMGIVMQ